MSRGLRNNNPGNIEKNSTKWQGLSRDQLDSRFFQFDDIAYGYRAMFRTLRTYKEKHGMNTIEKMINRWAPPVENNTSAYVNAVAKASEISKDTEVDVYNKDLMCKIVAEMSRVENGKTAVMEDVLKGWELL